SADTFRAHPRPDRARLADLRWAIFAQSGRLVRKGSLQIGVDRGEELFGGQPRGVGSDENGQILGHLAALDGVDTDLLQRLGEANHLWGVVEFAAVLEATRPGKYRCNRVG